MIWKGIFLVNQSDNEQKARVGAKQLAYRGMLGINNSINSPDVEVTSCYIYNQNNIHMLLGTYIIRQYK